MPVVPPGSAPGTAPDMQDHVRTWLRQRTSHWQDWPPERLLAALRVPGTVVLETALARDVQDRVLEAQVVAQDGRVGQRFEVRLHMLAAREAGVVVR